MKICFPLEGFSLSGGMRVIIQIANGLAAKGMNVYFIVPEYASVPPYPLNERIEIIKIGTKKNSILYKLLYYLKLCTISAKGYDICFATGYRTPYYIYISKIFMHSSAKLYYLVQGYEPESHVRQSINNPFLKEILYFAAIISYKLPYKKILVSNWVNEKIGNKAYKVVSNGIDLKIFNDFKIKKRNNRKFIIGAFGSTANYKGYKVFLEAIAKIPEEERSDINIIIASRQPVVLPLNISVVQILPENDIELAEFYRSCDLFIWTSFMEGFGLPPLEAMACGTPVITTDCGGIRDFANSENSIIVVPGDEIGICNNIIMLKENYLLRETLSKNGLETSKKFSVDNMVENYYKLLKEIKEV